MAIQYRRWCSFGEISSQIFIIREEKNASHVCGMHDYQESRSYTIVYRVHTYQPEQLLFYSPMFVRRSKHGVFFSGFWSNKHGMARDHDSSTVSLYYVFIDFVIICPFVYGKNRARLYISLQICMARLSAKASFARKKRLHVMDIISYLFVEAIRTVWTTHRTPSFYPLYVPSSVLFVTWYAYLSIWPTDWAIGSLKNSACVCSVDDAMQ